MLRRNFTLTPQEDRALNVLAKRDGKAHDRRPSRSRIVGMLILAAATNVEPEAKPGPRKGRA